MRAIRVVCAAFVLTLAPAAPPLAGQQPAYGWKPFSHRTHVPSEWVDDEVWRDCRGCHDYERPAGERTPLPDVCIRCHIHGTKAVKLAGEWRGTNSVRGGDLLFDHREHLGLGCATCHLEKDVQGATRAPATLEAPEHFQVPAVSMAYCFRCHDPAKGQTTPGQHARFIAGLNRKLEARQGRERALRPFSHADHLAPEDIAAKDHAKCTGCHAGLDAADARTLGEKQFSTETCGRCHTASFEVDRYLKASPTVATFLHRYHLRPQALEKDEELNRQRCFQCHQWSPKPGGPTPAVTAPPVRRPEGPSPAVAAGAATQPEPQTSRADDFTLCEPFLARPRQGKGPASCLSCHHHKDLGVEEHGQVAKCRECHILEERFTDLARLAQNRPTVEVRRPKVTAFAASWQSHPLLTGGGVDPAGKDCAKCHLSKLPELPSRIKTREFIHRTHLPAEADRLKAEDCQRCHTEVKLTSSPADIRAHTLASGVALHYAPAACVACHKGRELGPILEGETRRVPAFSHLDHLKRNAPGSDRPADCLDCHRLKEGSDSVGNSLPPSIADCTQCHSHKQHPEITGDLTSAEIELCGRCHTIGVPRKGEPVVMERLRIKSAAGHQVHKAGQACSECHRVREATPEPPAKFEPRLLATAAKTVPHALASKQRAGAAWTACGECVPDQPNPHREDWYFRDSAHCIDCHWFRRKQSINLQGEPYSQLLPGDLRALYGSKKEGKKHPLPGIPPAR